jgi:PPM family protein phosphatase
MSVAPEKSDKTNPPTQPGDLPQRSRGLPNTATAHQEVTDARDHGTVPSSVPITGDKHLTSADLLLPKPGDPAPKPGDPAPKPGAPPKPGDPPPPPPPPKLKPSEIEQRVQDLHTALHDKDTDKSQHLLENIGQENKTALEVAYKAKYDKDSHDPNSLYNDINGNFKDVDFAKLANVWNRNSLPNGRANYAGDVNVLVTQLKHDSDSANPALTSYLSTLTSAQITQMKTDYQSQFGMTFEDGIKKYGSDENYHSFQDPESKGLLLKGIDKRTADDDIQLAKNIAPKETGKYALALIAAALGNDSQASKDARTKLQTDQGFQDSLKAKLSGDDLQSANDFITGGKLALATQLGQIVPSTDDDKKKYEQGKTLAESHNQGNGDTEKAALAYFNDMNKKVSSALSLASPEEQQRFAQGHELWLSHNLGTDETQKAALAYFNQLEGHFSQITADGSKERAQLEDQAANGKPTIITAIAANSKDTASMLAAVSGMSEGDWKKLTDPSTSKASLDTLQASLQYCSSDQQKQQVMALINQKIQAKDFTTAQTISAAFLPTIQSDQSASNTLSAIEHMNQDDAGKYKTDAAFRAQVDTASRTLAGNDKALADNLLAQIGSSGKPLDLNQLDPVSATFVDVGNNVPKEKQIEDFQRAVAALNLNPAQKSELASGNSNDPTVQAFIKLAQDKLGDDGNTILKNGALPLDQQWNNNVDKTYILGQLAGAPESDRQHFLSVLSDDERKVAQAVLQNKNDANPPDPKLDGQPTLADQMRLVSLGSNKDYSSIGEQLSKLKPEEKAALFAEYAQKYGTTLSADFLSKVDKSDKTEYQDYLSLTAVNARTDLGAVLAAGDNFGGTVEGHEGTAAFTAVQQFTEAVANSALGKAMSPEQLEQFNHMVGQAQDEYDQARQKFGDDNPSLWHKYGKIVIQIGVFVAAAALASTGVGLLADAGLFAMFAAEAGAEAGAAVLTEATTEAAAAALADTTASAVTDAGVTALADTTASAVTDATAAGANASAAGANASAAGGDASVAGAGAGEGGSVVTDAAAQTGLRGTVNSVRTAGIRATANQGSASINGLNLGGKVLAKATEYAIGGAAYVPLTGGESKWFGESFAWSDPANLAKTFGEGALSLAAFGVAEKALSGAIGGISTQMAARAASKVLGDEGGTITHILDTAVTNATSKAISDAAGDAIKVEAKTQRAALNKALSDAIKDVIVKGPLEGTPEAIEANLKAAITKAMPSLEQAPELVNQITKAVDKNLTEVVNGFSQARQVLLQAAAKASEITPTKLANLPHAASGMVLGNALSAAATTPLGGTSKFNLGDISDAVIKSFDSLDVTQAGNALGAGMLLLGGGHGDRPESETAGTTGGDTGIDTRVSPATEPAAVPDSSLLSPESPSGQVVEPVATPAGGPPVQPVVAPTDAAGRPPAPTDAAGRPPAPTDLAGRPPAPTDLAGRPPAPTDLAGRPPAPTDAAGRPPAPTDAAGRPPVELVAARGPLTEPVVARSDVGSPGSKAGVDRPSPQELQTYINSLDPRISVKSSDAGLADPTVPINLHVDGNLDPAMVSRLQDLAPKLDQPISVEAQSLAQNSGQQVIFDGQRGLTINIAQDGATHIDATTFDTNGAENTTNVYAFAQDLARNSTADKPDVVVDGPQGQTLSLAASTGAATVDVSQVLNNTDLIKVLEGAQELARTSKQQVSITDPQSEVPVIRLDGTTSNDHLAQIATQIRPVPRPVAGAVPTNTVVAAPTITPGSRGTVPSVFARSANGDAGGATDVVSLHTPRPEQLTVATPAVVSSHLVDSADTMSVRAINPPRTEQFARTEGLGVDSINGIPPPSAPDNSPVSPASSGALNTGLAEPGPATTHPIAPDLVASANGALARVTTDASVRGGTGSPTGDIVRDQNISDQRAEAAANRADAAKADASKADSKLQEAATRKSDGAQSALDAQREARPRDQAIDSVRVVQLRSKLMQSGLRPDLADKLLSLRSFSDIMQLDDGELRTLINQIERAHENPIHLGFDATDNETSHSLNTNTVPVAINRKASEASVLARDAADPTKNGTSTGQQQVKKALPTDRAVPTPISALLLEQTVRYQNSLWQVKVRLHDGAIVVHDNVFERHEQQESMIIGAKLFEDYRPIDIDKDGQKFYRGPDPDDSKVYGLVRNDGDSVSLSVREDYRIISGVKHDHLPLLNDSTKLSDNHKKELSNFLEGLKTNSDFSNAIERAQDLGDGAIHTLLDAPNFGQADVVISPDGIVTVKNSDATRTYEKIGETYSPVKATVNRAIFDDDFNTNFKIARQGFFYDENGILSDLDMEDGSTLNYHDGQWYRTFSMNDQVTSEQWWHGDIEALPDGTGLKYTLKQPPSEEFHYNTGEFKSGHIQRSFNARDLSLSRPGTNGTIERTLANGSVERRPLPGYGKVTLSAPSAAKQLSIPTNPFAYNEADRELLSSSIDPISPGIPGIRPNREVDVSSELVNYWLHTDASEVITKVDAEPSGDGGSTGDARITSTTDSGTMDTAARGDRELHNFDSEHDQRPGKKSPMASDLLKYAAELPNGFDLSKVAAPRNMRISEFGLSENAGTKYSRKGLADNEVMQDNSAVLRDSDSPLRPQVSIVADGAGGYGGGAAASQIAIDSLSDGYKSLPENPSAEEVKTWLKTQIEVAHNRISKAQNSAKDASKNGQPVPKYKGKSTGGDMLSTIVVTAMDANGLVHAAWVGDSRLYRIRSDEIKRCTRDHSFVQQLVQGGHFDPARTGEAPNRNLITNALGKGRDFEIGLQSYQALAGDRYVLVCDGINDILSDSLIKDAAGKSNAPKEACDALIEAALREGRKISPDAIDNLSAVAFDVAGESHAPYRLTFGGHVVPIDAGEMIQGIQIGRGVERFAKILGENIFVSGNHASVGTDAQGTFIADNNSTNGTFIQRRDTIFGLHQNAVTFRKWNSQTRRWSELRNIPLNDRRFYVFDDSGNKFSRVTLEQGDEIWLGGQPGEMVPGTAVLRGAKLALNEERFDANSRSGGEAIRPGELNKYPGLTFLKQAPYQKLIKGLPVVEQRNGSSLVSSTQTHRTADGGIEHTVYANTESRTTVKLADGSEIRRTIGFEGVSYEYRDGGNPPRVIRTIAIDIPGTIRKTNSEGEKSKSYADSSITSLEVYNRAKTDLNAEHSAFTREVERLLNARKVEPGTNRNVVAAPELSLPDLFWPVRDLPRFSSVKAKELADLEGSPLAKREVVAGFVGSMLTKTKEWRDITDLPPQDLEAALKERLEGLQVSVNEFLAAHELPTRTIELAGKDKLGSAAAKYIASANGKGTIILAKEKVLTNIDQARLISDLLHEIGHSGQHDLIHKVVDNDLNVVQSERAKELKQAFETNKPLGEEFRQSERDFQAVRAQLNRLKDVDNRDAHYERLRLIERLKQINSYRETLDTEYMLRHEKEALELAEMAYLETEAQLAERTSAPPEVASEKSLPGRSNSVSRTGFDEGGIELHNFASGAENSASEHSTPDLGKLGEGMDRVLEMRITEFLRTEVGSESETSLREILSQSEKSESVSPEQLELLQALIQAKQTDLVEAVLQNFHDKSKAREIVGAIENGIDCYSATTYVKLRNGEEGDISDELSLLEGFMDLDRPDLVQETLNLLRNFRSDETVLAAEALAGGVDSYDALDMYNALNFKPDGMDSGVSGYSRKVNPKVVNSVLEHIARKYGDQGEEAKFIARNLFESKLNEEDVPVLFDLLTTTKDELISTEELAVVSEFYKEAAKEENSDTLSHTQEILFTKIAQNRGRISTLLARSVTLDGKSHDEMYDVFMLLQSTEDRGISWDEAFLIKGLPDYLVPDIMSSVETLRGSEALRVAKALRNNLIAPEHGLALMEVLAPQWFTCAKMTVEKAHMLAHVTDRQLREEVLSALSLQSSQARLIAEGVLEGLNPSKAEALFTLINRDTLDWHTSDELVPEAFTHISELSQPLQEQIFAELKTHRGDQVVSIARSIALGEPLRTLPKVSAQAVESSTGLLNEEKWLLRALQGEKRSAEVQKVIAEIEKRDPAAAQVAKALMVGLYRDAAPGLYALLQGRVRNPFALNRSEIAAQQRQAFQFERPDHKVVESIQSETLETIRDYLNLAEHDREQLIAHILKSYSEQSLEAHSLTLETFFSGAELQATRSLFRLITSDRSLEITLDDLPVLKFADQNNLYERIVDNLLDANFKTLYSDYPFSQVYSVPRDTMRETIKALLLGFNSWTAEKVLSQAGGEEVATGDLHPLRLAREQGFTNLLRVVIEEIRQRDAAEGELAAAVGEGLNPLDVGYLKAGIETLSFTTEERKQFLQAGIKVSSNRWSGWQWGDSDDYLRLYDDYIARTSTIAKSSSLNSLSSRQTKAVFDHMYYWEDSWRNVSTEDLTSACVAWESEPTLPIALASSIGRQSAAEQLASVAAWQNALRETDIKPKDMKPLANQFGFHDGQPPRAVLKSFERWRSDLEAKSASAVIKIIQGDRALPLAIQAIHGNVLGKTEQQVLILGLEHSQDRSRAIRLLNPQAFQKATAHLYANEPERQFIPRASTGLALVFGSKWKNWLDQQSNLGRNAHDASVWLPISARGDLRGLQSFLQTHASKDISDLQTIANRWSSIKESKSRLGSDATFDQVLELARSIVYDEINNDAFAIEEAKFGYSNDVYPENERRFEASLHIAPAFDLATSYTIDGLTARFLARDDVRGVHLGNHTHCCQHPGGDGDSSAWDGQENPNSGFWVVEDSAGEIVAMSWVRIKRDAQNNSVGVLFDNIEGRGLLFEGAAYENESEESRIARHKRISVVQDLLQHTADGLAAEHGIVTVGTGYDKLEVDDKWKEAPDNQLLTFDSDVYSDAENQRILAYPPKPELESEASEKHELEKNSETQQTSADTTATSSKVREAEASDMQAMESIAREVYPSDPIDPDVPGGWQQVPLHPEDTARGARGLVVESAERGIVGYATYEPAGEGKWYISDLAVSPGALPREDTLQLIVSLFKTIKELGGEWSADMRDSTSYNLFNQFAERRGVVERIRPDEISASMNGEPMHNVAFRINPDADLDLLARRLGLPSSFATVPIRPRELNRDPGDEPRTDWNASAPPEVASEKSLPGRSNSASRIASNEDGIELHNFESGAEKSASQHSTPSTNQSGSIQMQVNGELREISRARFESNFLALGLKPQVLANYVVKHPLVAAHLGLSGRSALKLKLTDAFAQHVNGEPITVESLHSLVQEISQAQGLTSASVDELTYILAAEIPIPVEGRFELRAPWKPHSDSAVNQLEKLNAPSDNRLGVPIRKLDGASERFYLETKATYDALPSDVRELLAMHGYEIVVARRGVDAFPEMSGEQQRGWREGTSVENNGAFLRHRDKVIAMVERAHDYDLDQWGVVNAVNLLTYKTGNNIAILRHEVGHAVDHALGYFSRSEVFHDAYQKDLANLSDEQKAEFDYYVQLDTPGAGQSEALADLFAHILGGSSAPGISEAFPEATAALEAHLSDAVQNQVAHGVPNENHSAFEILHQTPEGQIEKFSLAEKFFRKVPGHANEWLVSDGTTDQIKNVHMDASGNLRIDWLDGCLQTMKADGGKQFEWSDARAVYAPETPSAPAVVETTSGLRLHSVFGTDGNLSAIETTIVNDDGSTAVGPAYEKTPEGWTNGELVLGQKAQLTDRGTVLFTDLAKQKFVRPNLEPIELSYFSSLGLNPDGSTTLGLRYSNVEKITFDKNGILSSVKLLGSTWTKNGSAWVSGNSSQALEISLGSYGDVHFKYANGVQHIARADGSREESHRNTSINYPHDHDVPDFVWSEGTGVTLRVLPGPEGNLASIEGTSKSIDGTTQLDPLWTFEKIEDGWLSPLSDELIDVSLGKDGTVWIKGAASVLKSLTPAATWRGVNDWSVVTEIGKNPNGSVVINTSAGATYRIFNKTKPSADAVGIHESETDSSSSPVDAKTDPILKDASTSPRDTTRDTTSPAPDSAGAETLFGDDPIKRDWAQLKRELPLLDKHIALERMEALADQIAQVTTADQIHIIAELFESASQLDDVTHVLMVDKLTDIIGSQKIRMGSDLTRRILTKLKEFSPADEAAHQFLKDDPDSAYRRLSSHLINAEEFLLDQEMLMDEVSGSSAGDLELTLQLLNNARHCDLNQVRTQLPKELAEPFDAYDRQVRKIAVEMLDVDLSSMSIDQRADLLVNCVEVILSQDGPAQLFDKLINKVTPDRKSFCDTYRRLAPGERARLQAAFQEIGFATKLGSVAMDANTETGTLSRTLRTLQMKSRLAEDGDIKDYYAKRIANVVKSLQFQKQIANYAKLQNEFPSHEQLYETSKEAIFDELPDHEHRAQQLQAAVLTDAASILSVHLQAKGLRVESRTMKSFLEGLPRDQIQNAIEHIADRSQHLSYNGLEEQFGNLRTQLTDAHIHNTTDMLRNIQRVHVAVFEAVQAEEFLAYGFAKATGLGIKVHLVQDATQFPADVRGGIVLGKVPDHAHLQGDWLTAENSSAIRGLNEFDEGINFVDIANLAANPQDFAARLGTKPLGLEGSGSLTEGQQGQIDALLKEMPGSHDENDALAMWATYRHMETLLADPSLIYAPDQLEIYSPSQIIDGLADLDRQLTEIESDSANMIDVIGLASRGRAESNIGSEHAIAYIKNRSLGSAEILRATPGADKAGRTFMFSDDGLTSGQQILKVIDSLHPQLKEIGAKQLVCRVIAARKDGLNSVNAHIAKLNAANPDCPITLLHVHDYEVAAGKSIEAANQKQVAFFYMVPNGNRQPVQDLLFDLGLARSRTADTVERMPDSKALFSAAKQTRTFAETGEVKEPLSNGFAIVAADTTFDPLTGNPEFASSKFDQRVLRLDSSHQSVEAFLQKMEQLAGGRFEDMFGSNFQSYFSKTLEDLKADAVDVQDLAKKIGEYNDQIDHFVWWFSEVSRSISDEYYPVAERERIKTEALQLALEGGPKADQNVSALLESKEASCLPLNVFLKLTADRLNVPGTIVRGAHEGVQLRPGQGWDAGIDHAWNEVDIPGRIQLDQNGNWIQPPGTLVFDPEQEVFGKTFREIAELDSAKLWLSKREVGQYFRDGKNEINSIIDFPELGDAPSDATPDGDALDADKSKILQGARDFTHELLDQYPQVDADGKLNYYLAGSLGTMLLLGARQFEPIHADDLGAAGGKSVQLPAASQEQLNGFIRQIGDLDFVRLDHYTEGAVRLRKGGGGPAYADLSESAQNLFSPSEVGGAVMCDPLTSFGTHDAVRINVDGRDVYVSSPLNTFSYKTVHMAESFFSKPSKMMNDFKQLLDVLSTIYPERSLVQAAHDQLFNYNPNSVQGLFIPSYHPEFSGHPQSFFESVIASDSNAKFLDGLQYGRERAIGILKLLNRLTTAEDKQAAVDFINHHRGIMDNWVSIDNAENKQELARYFAGQNELPDKLSKRIKGSPSEESIAEALKHISLANFDDVPVKLMKRPVDSAAMELLGNLNPERFADELSTVTYLIDHGVDAGRLNPILRSSLAQKTEDRQALLNASTYAVDNLSPDALKEFLYDLQLACRSRRRNTVGTASKDEALTIVQNVLKEYAIPVPLQQP